MKRILSAVTICSLAIGLCAIPALAGNMKGDFKGDLVRSSNLIGANLYNTNGDDIGQLNDIVVDENTGGMSNAILAAGGFLGIGDNLTPVTWKDLKVTRNEDGNLKLVTGLDKARLTDENSFEKNNWMSTDDTWMKQLPHAAGKKLVRLSKVNDAKLFDQSGHQIGAIEDVVVDAKSGKAAYAVISFSDDFINQGDKVTMVPFKLVRQSEKDTPGFVLHADKSKIETALFFDKNDWPNMDDMTWNKKVYDHFAVTPYYWTNA